ncbi:glycoside hydrolase family 2, partial [candidate division KSB1 bacterium]|nr:glycoside hydrolase family 2 [candidate division KSB1 bacterium]
MRFRTFVLLLALLMTIPQLLSAQERITTTLQNGWKFFKGENDPAFQKSFDDSEWPDVTLPHDWAIAGPFIKNGNGDTGKLPWRGEGWYRKHLDIPDTYEGNTIYLLFDGIMAFPSVFINGRPAGKWDYGYNSFYLDVTKFIEFHDENVIAIHVDTRKHDSRWYPGAGIYRKIQMITVNPVHVDIWGTYITTPIIKSHYADVRIATMVNNRQETDGRIQLEHIVYNSVKNKVCEGKVSTKVAAKQKARIETTLTIQQPRRWDIDQPNLYTVVTNVYRDDQIVDTYTSVFGIRDIRLTPD